MHLKKSLPLSLYIHMPWCAQKCPYCDFNSHASRDHLPEQLYLKALLDDLQQDLPKIEGRSLHSIFIGGGTPSLFSGAVISELLTYIRQLIPCEPDIEITLEANPGTVEQARFNEYYQAGVNRLSLGVQSFNEEHLKTLGRIHDAKQAQQAINIAQQAGFTNLNIDIMHALPAQTIAQALQELQLAIDNSPTHISWYQLTIEPNTVFYRHPPKMMNDEIIFEMQTQGYCLLAANGFKQYEVSAFAKSEKQCLHNLNYWQFGDYLGIGAGAHSKLTHIQTQTVTRFHKVKQPNHYLAADKPFIAQLDTISVNELIFEFMLNALRLNQVIEYELFTARTGLESSVLLTKFAVAKNKDLLDYNDDVFWVTPLGRRFLNNLIEIFLENG